MTLISNGPIPSSAVDYQDKSFKPESPPMNEVNRNRFKESLEKAIAVEKEVPESKEPLSGKKIKTEAHKKVSHSEKKPIEAEGKTLNTEKKAALITLLKNKNGKIELSKERPTVKILGSGQAVSTLKDGKVDKAAQTAQTDSMRKTVLKKSDMKSASLKTDENLNVDISAFEKEINGEEAILLNEADIDSKTGKEQENQVNSSNEESAAVIIPFPKTDETTFQASAVVAISKENGESNLIKSSGKNNKKTKEEQTITVLDARSHGKNENVSKDFVLKTASVSENIEQTAKESNQIVLGEQQSDKIFSEDSKSFESRFNANKEVLVARELKESGNNQIVKKASFILKDNNQGEIKLILKPESLGRVKIQLNVHENNLVAKIFVENSRVGQIFENNIKDLSQSFEEAGINSSSIEVSVGDGNKQSDDQEKLFQKDQPFYSGRLKTFEEAVPATGRYGSDNNHQLVNLVV